MKTIVGYVGVALLGIFTFLVVSNYVRIQEVDIPSRTSEDSIAGVDLEADTKVFVQTAATQPQMQLPVGLAIQLNTNKDVYILGEPVILTLQVLNQSSSPILIHKVSNVGYGLVWPQITQKDEMYRRYVGPEFGTIDAILEPNPLAPGEQLSMSFTILYNVISTLPERLPTVYAFKEPGEYLLRVEFINLVPDQRFVSDPIQVTVVAPQGDDAAVWRLLQTEEGAYFLHIGFPLEDGHIAKEFEQIIAHYPNTTYAPYIRASLDKFDAMEGRLGNTIQSADAKVDQGIVVIENQPLMVGTQSDLSDTNRDATTQTIVNLVDDWVRAYNAQDIPQFVQYFSLKTTIRQKWEQGPGDKDRETIDNRFRETFTSMGSLSIQIIRLTIEDRMATADVVLSFERSTEIAPHQTMKFELGDDEAWKILDAGF